MIVLGFAALEGDAVLLAEEIDGHAVAGSSGAINRLVANALLAQNGERAVHFGVADFEHRTLDFNARQIAQLDFGINLENGRELEVSLALGGLRFDARVTGNAQLLRFGDFAERFFERVVERLVARLVAVLLLDHRRRHLARTEARHLHVLAQALQALLDFLVEIGDSDRQIQTTLKGVGQLRGFDSGVCDVRFH